MKLAHRLTSIKKTQQQCLTRELGSNLSLSAIRILYVHRRVFNVCMCKSQCLYDLSTVLVRFNGNARLTLTP